MVKQRVRPLTVCRCLYGPQAAAREAIALLDNPLLVGEPRLPEDLAGRQAAAAAAGGGVGAAAGLLGGGSSALLPGGAGGAPAAGAPTAAAAAAAAQGIYMGQ